MASQTSPLASRHIATSSLSQSRYHKPRLQWLLAVLVVICLVRPAVSAVLNPGAVADLPTETPAVGPHETWVDGARETLEELGDGELRRRQDDPDTTASSPTPSGTGSEGDNTEGEESSSSTPSSTTRPSTTGSIPSELPSPFDNNLDFNFTTNGGKSCPEYLNALFASPTFKGCYPLSVMLKTSLSFFAAMKELQSITTVLDATCAADVDSCTTYLKQEARNLISDKNCGEEFRGGQPNIYQAFLGLRAYEPLYKATCLRDADSSYCFANAVTNSSTPANAYFYFLPLNMSLPQQSNPACTTCLQDTMAIFQAASAYRKQAIASTYESAAVQVNSICGPDFVNATLPPEIPESAAGLVSPSWAVMSTMAVIALLNWAL